MTGSLVNWSTGYSPCRNTAALLQTTAGAAAHQIYRRLVTKTPIVTPRPHRKAFHWVIKTHFNRSPLRLKEQHTLKSSPLLPHRPDGSGRSSETHRNQRRSQKWAACLYTPDLLAGGGRRDYFLFVLRCQGGKMLLIQFCQKPADCSSVKPQPCSTSWHARATRHKFIQVQVHSV